MQLQAYAWDGGDMTLIFLVWEHNMEARFEALCVLSMCFRCMYAAMFIVGQITVNTVCYQTVVV